jgi:hypothetical protein
LGTRRRKQDFMHGFDALCERGVVFGVIPRNQRDNWFVGEQVVVRTAKGSDGNLKAMVERVE